jgi:Alcohol dehydrogenase GroES-like domain
VYHLASNGDVVAFKIDRLEKQPTDLGRHHHCMRDGALSMKILQFNGPWQLSIEEASTPSFGPEEVLIRSDAVGICGSDVHGFTGESGRRKPGMVMGNCHWSA